MILTVMIDQHPQPGTFSSHYSNLFPLVHYIGIVINGYHRFRLHVCYPIIGLYRGINGLLFLKIIVDFPFFNYFILFVLRFVQQAISVTLFLTVQLLLSQLLI